MDRLLPCPQDNPSLAASFRGILSKLLIPLRLILLTSKMGAKIPCPIVIIRINLAHAGKDLSFLRNTWRTDINSFSSSWWLFSC